jgi:hypothetical protein
VRTTGRLRRAQAAGVLPVAEQTSVQTPSKMAF